MENFEKIPNIKSNKNNLNRDRKNRKESSFYENLIASNFFFLDKSQKETRCLIRDKFKDSTSNNPLSLDSEKESLEMKKRKKKEDEFKKIYIVDDINNIFALLKESKFKLYIQKYLNYFLIFLTCIYYRIFLFSAGIKFERSYFMTDYQQFIGCHDEIFCDFLENSANIIIYNKSFTYYNISSYNNYFFVEEENTVNKFYRPFFIKYSNFHNNYKLTSTIQKDYITDKPMLCVVITNKEKWNVYLRYFTFCEYVKYHFIIVYILGLGGILGSLFFGLLSDIYGRRLIILITLFITTLSTFGIYTLSLILDLYNKSELNFYQEKCFSKEIYCYDEILPEIYAQIKTKKKFEELFIYFLFCIFFLNFSLWPLLKSCLSLLVENSKGEVDVLNNFRRYNFLNQGLPPLFTALLFVNLNNFNLTFLILGISNLISLILSYIFLDESIRYYHEYSEWEKITNIIFNNFKIKIKDFRTLNENEFKEFQKKENSKSFYKIKSNTNNIINKSYFVTNQNYFKNLIDACSALKRNIKRNADFIIKLDDVKLYPLLIVTSLFANNALNNSKTLLLIILILLYIIKDLFEKELLEPPYFSTRDLYFGKGFNYIINNIFFIYLIINYASNYCFYCFYRIEYFKTVIYISQFIISLTLIIYHFIITNVADTPMNFSEYNFNMLNYFLRDIRSEVNLFLLFIIYFCLNGVIFYVYLLILKISKTIYRCTFLSLHSISLIIATVISEFIYYYCENYFLFLGALNTLCLLIFFFLNDFKELLYIMNDLKVKIFDIKKMNWRDKIKAI